MSKNYVRENVPLSRFGVLVAQLESIVASVSHKPPDALLCFDLLSDLISAIDEESKDSILLWQRKCEDALYSLLVLGARRPVRHLASVAMARIIQKGDGISIYSRASSLQGFLSDGKKSEPQQVAGAAQCLGELYCCFGRRITSGLHETTVIVSKLLKFNEDFVRQEALHMLWNALEGSGGNAASSAYTEAFRILMRMAVGDKSYNVRIAAAKCLKAFANIGGPGLGVAELETSSSFCVKALEDSVSSVRDAFAEALGALLALGMNPDAQVQPRGKGHFTPKKLDGALERHLIVPFLKASGARAKHLRIGLTLSWVSLLQTMRLKYLQPDIELQSFLGQVMDMLRSDSFDAQALACILYILRVGITDQMSEPSQRSFLVLLGKQLQSPNSSSSMRVAALRTMSYTLKTLGEVPHELKEVLDDTIVAALSHSSALVRVEAALTLRSLAEIDPTCVGGLISYAVTMLDALRENISFEKGSNLQVDLDSLHGQAAVLAALVSISPKLPLGYPARLPRVVLHVSKKMLMESRRNKAAASVEKEAGWALLSSLLASMPKEEIEDQIFDILSLWASVFGGNLDETDDLASMICVCSAAIDALTAFVKCFLSSDTVDKGILLQPVLLYLSRALSWVSSLAAKDQTSIKPAMDVLIIRILIAYQSLYDPTAYRSDHAHIIRICTTPFREASKCDESSCLRMLLDKRDAWLGPWNPGRDSLEDELRSFQGGKNGILPCVWESEPPNFPQPETISKSLVNQMLLCFGTMFSSQDSGGMLSLLGMIEQCLKAGKKQAWRAASITNICVGLLAGLKALLALRPEHLGLEILGRAQTIFQSILAEGDICASQRRASSEGLGLLARLGNDIFAAKLTRLLLTEVTGAAESVYAGSLALALGCIHRSAGGMALSSIVPTTVNSISLLAKGSMNDLKIWSLNGLTLTIEAAGLSYISHVQATLGLAMDILLSDEIGWVDLQQGVARLINAIVAVLGPEIAPGSIFFSRCKSVVAEVSSQQETATLLESVRFTQQLVLFAPQAVSVHFHVQTLLPTLSSRQPILRHLALSTLRHLIEKDPVSIIKEQIEETLFHMLDEETDSEIGSLARTTIMRLLNASCPSHPSHWLSILRNMILATSLRRDGRTDLENDSSSGLHGEGGLPFGQDDENMVSSSRNSPVQNYAHDFISSNSTRNKHLRYRTRVFAAECLSHLPEAVGKNSMHFDPILAREQPSRDWLVLQLQELMSLAYQISTIQFENMRPIGVALLSTIVNKFEVIPDPELPGHLLLEQYQAQLLSAVRTALDPSSGPSLLEAGLELATKILTCGIISQDQVAVKRIFSLISRPLDDFNDLCYPSFAEWVSCKIKIRLLTAHASLKCYTYAFLRRQDSHAPDEYLALLPLLSKSSCMLGAYWLSVLKDYTYVCFQSHPKENWKPFLDGIQSSLVSNKLQPCLDEAWPVILQALALDAVPANFDANRSADIGERTESIFISGYRMVELQSEDLRFLWGFSLLLLFQGQDSARAQPPVAAASKSKWSCVSLLEDANSFDVKLYASVLPVFEFLSTERFFNAGFLTMDICIELLQVFSYCIVMKDTWDSFAISVLAQMVKHCPKDFLEEDNFVYYASELCFAFLFKHFLSDGTSPQDHSRWEEDKISTCLTAIETLLRRLGDKMLLKSLLAYLLIGCKCIGATSTELGLSRANDFMQNISLLLKRYADEKSESIEDDDISYLAIISRGYIKALSQLVEECIQGIHLLENKNSDLRKLLQMKLTLSLDQVVSSAKIIFEIRHHGENQENNPILSTMLHHSTQCFQSVLSNSGRQVQATGLQVLRGMLQRGSIAASNSFLTFFVGELAGNIFSIIREILKEPVNGEAVAISGECLKILMLLQTLSKDSECQKGLMNLLLGATVMAFSSAEEQISQESSDLRSTAVKLVSQLAQIPTSAVYFKDALLSMSVGQRQQLQDIIRASVTLNQNPTQLKAAGPPLVVKLPAQIEKNQEKATPLSAPGEESDNISEDEQDDDWDAFQSFPASNVPTPEITVEEARRVESSSNPHYNNSRNYESKGESGFLPPNDMKEVVIEDQESTEEVIVEDQVGAESETTTKKTDGVNEGNPLHDSLDNSDVAEQSNDQHQEMNGVVGSHEDDQAFSDLHYPEGGREYSEPCESHDKMSTPMSPDNNHSPSDSRTLEVVESCSACIEHLDETGGGCSNTNEGISSELQTVKASGINVDEPDHHQQKIAGNDLGKVQPST